MVKLVSLARSLCSFFGWSAATEAQAGGSATEQNGVQDFKISRFHWDLRISMGFQFMDFEISMGFMGFLWDYFHILRK